MSLSRKRRHSETQSVNSSPTRNVRQQQQIADEVDHDAERLTTIQRPSPIDWTENAEFEECASKAPSPSLMGIPPELRERILKLVLGGKVIHVYTETSSEAHSSRARLPLLGTSERKAVLPVDIPRLLDATLSHQYFDSQDRWLDIETADKQTEYTQMLHSLTLCRSICESKIKDHDNVAHIKAEAESTRRSEHRSWRSQHQHCRHAFQKDLHHPPASLDLGVLSVCRDLHREAKVLPFKENTFAFTHLAHLELFVSKLTAAQATAVRDITLAYAYWQSKYYSPAIEDKIWTAFQDLKSLTIILQSNVAFGRGDERLRICADLMQFKKLQIKSVSVSAYVVDPFFLQGFGFTFEQFETWAKDLEEQLKKDWCRPHSRSNYELELQQKKEARSIFGFSEEWK